MRVDILEFGLVLSRGTPEPRSWWAFCLFEVELRFRVGVKIIHLVVYSQDDIPTVPEPTCGALNKTLDDIAMIVYTCT